MSSLLHDSAQAFLARYQGLADRLVGGRETRAAAAAAFAAHGLPGLREEAWRYTSLRPLADIAFHEPLSLLADHASLMAKVPEIAAPHLVFFNGRRQEEGSTALAHPLPGLHVAGFADAPQFGALGRPQLDMLVALNTMLAEDGASLRLDAGCDGGTLVLVHLAEDVHGRPAAFHPRHAIHLGKGASLDLVEIFVGQGVYFHNPVSEIVLDDGARLSHVRIQTESAAAFHLATLYAEIGAAAIYDGFTGNFGARLARTEIHARMAGTGGLAQMNGVQLLRDAQHADITTIVAHDAPSCASRQTIRNVLAGQARGVFQGRISVARAAQKTDGYQMSQALLLSPQAEIDCKPELEIYADDVKCSHGATIGELDADQLFYLRSRGVPEQAARAMLVQAFLTESFASIGNVAVRGVLETICESWWEGAAR